MSATSAVSITKTYRPAARTARHDNIDDRVGLKLVDATFGHELLCARVPAENLQKNRDRRGRVRNIVDSEAGCIILYRY